MSRAPGTLPRPVAALLLAGCLAACVDRQPPLGVSTGDLVLDSITLLDPGADGALAVATVVVRDGVIASVLDPGTPLDDGGAVRVDGAGLFLLPGLWDLHTHLGNQGAPAAALMVSQGVTGARDMGGELDKIEPLHRRIQAGEISGPRIVKSGPTLNGAVPAPHHRLVDSPPAAVQAVAELKALGMDFLKIHNQTTREVYFPLLETADQEGLSVVGHVPVTVDPLEACRAGQASIEHIATLFEGTYLAAFEDQRQAFAAMPAWVDNDLDELVACFAERATLFVPTLRAYQIRAEWADWHDHPDPRLRYLPAELVDGWRQSRPATDFDRDPEVIRIRNSLVEVGQEVVRRLHAAGAPIGAGTDFGGAGLIAGFDLHAEIRLLAAAGLTPREALAASTRGPGAAAAGHPLDGRIVAGAPADLVLLRANAFDDLAALDEIEAVVRGGSYLDRRALDGILNGLEGPLPEAPRAP